MRLCAQHRLRLSLTQQAHSPFPRSSTNYLIPSIQLFANTRQSVDNQARISTSAARLASSVKHLQSRLNWSQTAHRPRAVLETSTSQKTTDQKLGLPLDQIRSHMGHSHAHGGHHHHHDNTFLTSRNRNDPGVKITMTGLYVNVGMAVSKGIGGYVFNSQAYVAIDLQLWYQTAGRKPCSLRAEQETRGLKKNSG